MNVLDFSSLWLIEDSADSEGDDPAGLFRRYPSNIGHKEEDDAESCTCECDTSGIGNNLLKEDDRQGCGEFCGDGDEGYGLNCSCSTMWNMSDAALEVAQCSSPNFLVDDDDEVTRMVKVNVDDVDDKLFWEICMAVGYP